MKWPVPCLYSTSVQDPSPLQNPHPLCRRYILISSHDPSPPQIFSPSFLLSTTLLSISFPPPFSPQIFFTDVWYSLVDCHMRETPLFSFLSGTTISDSRRRATLFLLTPCSLGLLYFHYSTSPYLSPPFLLLFLEISPHHVPRNANRVVLYDFLYSLWTYVLVIFFFPVCYSPGAGGTTLTRVMRSLSSWRSTVAHPLPCSQVVSSFFRSLTPEDFFSGCFGSRLDILDDVFFRCEIRSPSVPFLTPRSSCRTLCPFSTLPL